MRAYIVGLLLISVNGLKLLNDLNKEKLFEDDDEEWETNIAFAVKPFKGECTSDAGSTKMAGGKINNPVVKGTCAAILGPPVAIAAKEVTKYCTDFHAPNDYAGVLTQLKGEKFYANASKPLWFKKTKKYIHYVAKILSMAKLTAHDSLVIKSFQVKPLDSNKAADGTVATFNVDALGGDKADLFWCYSTAGMSWAKNDPVVKNMNGEEFEIMATGVFSLLRLTTETQIFFQADATIDRAGTRCGATYIQNLTLSGEWVDDIALQQGFTQLKIRADAAVPKAQALQIKLNKDWQSTASQLPFDVIKHANAHSLNLKINSLDITVSVDSHRIHEEGKRTGRFANFLNVNFGNMSGVSGLYMGGLLGKDSHEEAVQLPEECEASKLMAAESSSKMLSRLNLA